MTAPASLNFVFMSGDRDALPADVGDRRFCVMSLGAAPPMKPLSERYRARAFVMREGAFDYRDIPSRMGDVLVPHGAKVPA